MVVYVQVCLGGFKMGQVSNQYVTGVQVSNRYWGGHIKTVPVGY